MARKCSTTPIFVAILMFITTTQALRDYGFSRHGTAIARRCEPVNNSCCARPNSYCQIRYYMYGIWFTNRDTVGGNFNCNTECVRHYAKCRNTCYYASGTDEVFSGTKCKCKRHPKIAVSTVRNSCFKYCYSAFLACRTACFKGAKCPLRALTRASWNAVYTGRCLLYCTAVKGEQIVTSPTCSNTASRSAEKEEDLIISVDDTKYVPEEKFEEENSIEK